MQSAEHPALTGLSPEQVGLAMAADERDQRGAQKREVLTELVVAVSFLVAAGAFWLAAGAPSPGATGIGLAVLYAVIARVEFAVGEGYARPVVLAVIPMLVLLEPSVVPLLVLVASFLACLPELVRGQMKPLRVLLRIGDTWYTLGAAALLALAPDPASMAAAAVLVFGALVVQSGLDFVVSSLRMWVGLGIDPRDDRRAYAWTYLVDFLLAPVGLLAAWAMDEHPAAPAALLPLAALLALFAHERRGRLQNAVALQRITEESRDRLESIVRHSSDLILIVDAAGHLQAVTGSTVAFRGGSGDLLLDRVHAGDVARVAGFLTAVADKPRGESAEAEWRMVDTEGAYRHVSVVATNLIDDPRVGGLVLTVRDNDARKRFEEQLRHRAFHDELTGLANRALFYDRAEHALSRRDSHVAVLFVDLDDFKPVNDRLGHAAGDQVLRLMAKRLLACVRSADTVARLGGDEFGILLEGAGEAQAIEAAERVLAAFEQRFELAGEAVRISGCVGIAINGEDVRDVEELLRAADRAMYEAKRGGKRRLAIHDPGAPQLDADGALRLFMSSEAQRAEIVAVLEDPDALTMVFQPVLDLRTGRVTAYEALARFNRTPVRTPDKWFAQAHRLGLGAALEARAVAVALAVEGRPAGTRLALNLSLSSLGAPEIEAVLPERLDDIVIEITENELALGDPQTAAALATLRARGAAIAVDDTGAGYAGLTHVMRLAPDIIKLDRALTTDIDADPVKAALVSSFVRYAREIDAIICAEGIETAAELEQLAELDVALGQGYYIARPAAPWVGVHPESATASRASFQAAFADDHVGSDLEQLMRDLALGAAGSLDAMAAALNADEVQVLPGPAQAAQVLVSDEGGEADELRAAGYGAKLVLPIGTHARLVAYSRRERPWTRFQLDRGRILAHQLSHGGEAS
ncbi:EAL domain-containing protein [Solirubrobacter taibaiensis]|nr:EAL domain-containing protein [Solirubrobacter taibaiensis]